MASESTFGDRLRGLRLEAGLTQSEFVRRSGIPKPTLSRYENDHVLPSLQTLARLARALRVPESALLPGKTTPEEELSAALAERGITIRTKTDARRIADAIARLLEERPDTIARSG